MKSFLPRSRAWQKLPTQAPWALPPVNGFTGEGESEGGTFRPPFKPLVCYSPVDVRRGFLGRRTRTCPRCRTGAAAYSGRKRPPFPSCPARTRGCRTTSCAQSRRGLEAISLTSSQVERSKVFSSRFALALSSILSWMRSSSSLTALSSVSSATKVFSPLSRRTMQHWPFSRSRGPISTRSGHAASFRTAAHFQPMELSRVVELHAQVAALEQAVLQLRGRLQDASALCIATGRTIDLHGRDAWAAGQGRCCRRGP